MRYYQSQERNSGAAGVARLGTKNIAKSQSQPGLIPANYARQVQPKAMSLRGSIQPHMLNSGNANH